MGTSALPAGTTMTLRRGALMDEQEHVLTVQVRLTWRAALRVLFGTGISVKVAYRGQVDKVVVFVGLDPVKENSA